ncbi:MAG: DUF3667 domain-containing protein [Gemmatimonadetes bacterium]|nr:DUF3667 domain-containing protein [Gemmatimonadota bacterium]
MFRFKRKKNRRAERGSPTRRDGDAGMAGPGIGHTIVCPNCGGGRSGRFCSVCGQNDRNYVRGLLPVMWEFGRESFEVDSRLFQTLKLLLFRPGRLSMEFCRNRRARFMTPVRMYLFASFVFFLVLVTVPDWSLQTGADVDLQFGEDPEEVDEELGAELAERVGNVVTEAEIDALKAVVRPEQSQRVDDLLGRPASDWSRGMGFMLARLAPRGDAPFDAVAPTMRDSLGVAVDSVPGSAGPAVDAEPPHFIVRIFFSAMVDFFHDPTRFLQQFIGNLPITMFFLLPFLAAALAICYARKRRFFVEHLVFAMHVQTFSFIVLTLALLVPFASIGIWVQLVLQLLLPIYGVVALRRFYGDGWIWTLVKGLIVWCMYWAVLVPGLLVTFFLTT